MRSKQRTRDKVGPLKDKNDKIIVDDQQGADLLNDYFSSVFTKENIENVPQPEQKFKGIDNEKLINLDITEYDVLQKLTKLKVDKSPGVDGIHPKLLFELRHEIAKPIAELFVKSLNQGDVPRDWRDASITALFKKGNRSDPGNYRPVSLTSIICKIMESIIKDKIVEHLQKFNLLNDSQHGFIKGKSCLTNLLEYLENVTKVLDEGDPLDVIYLDFAKAFDKVPHKRLIKKLEAHGISGNVSRWIKNWLTDRRQRVNINGKISNWADVLSGVPQGSVLGPLLFLIYINDIDDGIMSKIWKFADDTKICKNIKNERDVEILRNDLKQLYKWSEDWQMLFNLDKCVVIHMGNKNKKGLYELGGQKLKSVEQERDLGIIIHSNGKTSEQCTMAANKANQILGMIKRNIKWKDKNIITKLYKALVRPKLEYCVQAWCPQLKKDQEVLEKVQRRATKMMEGFRYKTYEERLHETGLTTLVQRRKRGDLIETFKLVKGITQVNHEIFFTIHENIGRGNMYKFAKHRSRLNVRASFFSQRVVNDWNKLPNDVVSADSVNAFKNRLDKIKF